MSQIESDFIAAINADPDDRDMQLIYADWLDEIGDPRAEAWRVLIEQGKRPEHDLDPLEGFDDWNWFPDVSYWTARVPHATLPDEDIVWYDALYLEYPTFFAAMDAACLAWVRCHRYPDFLKLETEGLYDNRH